MQHKFIYVLQFAKDAIMVFISISRLGNRKSRCSARLHFIGPSRLIFYAAWMKSGQF